MTRTLENAKPWLTVREAAALTGASVRTIWRILEDAQNAGQPISTEHVGLTRTLIVEKWAIVHAVASRHAERKP